METQTKIPDVEDVRAIKGMLKVLPPEIGAITKEDLEVIFSQKGKDGI